MTPEQATAIKIYAERVEKSRNYVQWFARHGWASNPEQRVELAEQYVAAWKELHELERQLASAIADATEETL